MTLDDYLAYNGPSPVAKIHESIVELNKVTCNYIHCNYEEEFDTVEDAEVAARIHEDNNSS